MKTTLVVIACSLLLAFSAASGTADTSNDQRVNVEDMTPLESVQGSWSDLFVSVPMDSLIGNDAGCDATGQPLQWAAPGTPAGPCAFAAHSFGITHTAMSCPAAACTADALDWLTFGSVFVSCTAGSLAIVDWTAGQVINLAGSCTASAAGDATTFSDWDSLGGGGKWSHTDNLGDAVVHLIA